MGILKDMLAERGMSQRAFQELANDIAKKNGRKGISQGTVSTFINQQVSTDIDTFYDLALALEALDPSRKAGEWLFRLIVEAGFPLKEVSSGDMRTWVEEGALRNLGVPGAATMSDLQRIRNEVNLAIRRLTEQQQ